VIRAALVLCLLSAVSLAGCAGTANVDKSVNPHVLSIEFEHSTKDRQYTYFVLEKSGQLHFAGGRMAQQHVTKPIMMLSADQFEQLWEVIDGNQLLKVKTKFSFPDRDRSRDVAKIRSRKGRNTVYSINNSVAGMAELHDLLFKFQANERYRLAPIEGHYKYGTKKK